MIIVQVLMADATLVEQEYKDKKRAEAEAFAAECRKHPLVSMVFVKTK